MKSSFEKPIVAGLAGALLLLLFYFSLVTFAQSFSHAIEQFKTLWYWILLLSLGFGAQAALYTYVRNEAAASASVAASGGVSGVSMVACCAHHLTDFLPLLGLSVAAVFLIKYQLFFIMLGVLSNFNGIIYMLSVIQRHNLAGRRGLLNALFRHDMRSVLKVSFVLSAVVAVAIYLR